jgi:hypothetical protein
MSWHLVDDYTFKDEKGVHKRDTRNEISLDALCSTRRGELHH